MSAKSGPEMSDPSYDDVVQFLRQKHEDDLPCVTTRDVAEQFDQVSRRTINKRLNTLNDRGRVAKREIGANDVVWWLPGYFSDSASFSRPASESQ